MLVANIVEYLVLGQADRCPGIRLEFSGHPNNDMMSTHVPDRTIVVGWSKMSEPERDQVIDQLLSWGWVAERKRYHYESGFSYTNLVVGYGHEQS